MLKANCKKEWIHLYYSRSKKYTGYDENGETDIQPADGPLHQANTG